MQLVAPGSNTSTSSGYKTADLADRPLLIMVREHKVGIPTVNGEKDAIACDIYDINNDTTIENQLLFGAYLVKNLKGHVGDAVLGKIVKGQPQPGKNAAWEIHTAMDDAAAVAKASVYLAGNSTPAPAEAPAPAAATLAATLDKDATIQELLAQLGAKPI